MESNAEALCLTENSDWEEIAARIGGTLVNRESGNSGDYETVIVIPGSRPGPAAVRDLRELLMTVRNAGHNLTVEAEAVAAQLRARELAGADRIMLARLEGARAAWYETTLILKDAMTPVAPPPAVTPAGTGYLAAELPRRERGAILADCVTPHPAGYRCDDCPPGREQTATVPPQPAPGTWTDS